MDKTSVRELELELEVLRTYASREQRENAAQLARERWHTEIITGKPWQVVEAEDRERQQWEDRRKVEDELLPIALGYGAGRPREMMEAWEALVRMCQDYRSGYLEWCKSNGVKPRL